MDLRQVRYFIEVVRAGTISGAAANLQMTQPPLSLAIAKLERELGVELLARTPKGVTTTEAGDYLVRNGNRLLNEAERMRHTLRSMGEGRAGMLRVAAGPILNWEFVPPLLAELAAQAPDAVVELSDPPSGTIIERLLRCEVDVGIVATGCLRELMVQYADDLCVEPVGTLPMVLGLPAQYADRGTTVSLSELEDQEWLVPQVVPGFPGMNLLFEQAWKRAGIAPRRVRSIATPQTAVPLVVAGVGVSFVPASRRQLHPDLVVREADPAIDPLTITVIWRRGADSDALLQRLLHIVRSGVPIPTSPPSAERAAAAN